MNLNINKNTKMNMHVNEQEHEHENEHVFFSQIFIFYQLILRKIIDDTSL
jgi:hypothetical protein